MPKPQQPELRRSGFTVLDPDSIGSDLEAEGGPSTDTSQRPVPQANQPGHHPDREQDQPDDDAFAARLGIEDDTGDAAG